MVLAHQLTMVTTTTSRPATATNLPYGFSCIHMTAPPNKAKAPSAPISGPGAGGSGGARAVLLCAHPRAPPAEQGKGAQGADQRPWVGIDEVIIVVLVRRHWDHASLSLLRTSVKPARLAAAGRTFHRVKCV